MSADHLDDVDLSRDSELVEEGGEVFLHLNAIVLQF